jgi:hypothetical protein
MHFDMAVGQNERPRIAELVWSLSGWFADEDRVCVAL